MIRRMLFPVDFSAACAGMAAYVHRAAALSGASVSLLHVCDLTSYNGFELYERPGSEIAEEHLNIAKDKLDRFLVAEFPRESSSRILLAGDAASLIAQTAKEKQCDLIVMPTHAGRFRRMLLGSTTAKVLDDAECPVLTMQHAETATPRSLEHRQWACGIALSADSGRVLQVAQSAASEIGAGLSVVHVIAAEGASSEGDPKSEQRESARVRLAELAAVAGYVGTVRIATGPVKEALLSAANESQADVLVIGRSAPFGLGGRMRDLAYTLIRDYVWPVVSV